MLLIETLAAVPLCLQSWSFSGASACGRGDGDLSYLAKSTAVTGGHFIIVTVTVRWLRPRQLFQFSPGLAAICQAAQELLHSNLRLILFVYDAGGGAQGRPVEIRPITPRAEERSGGRCREKTPGLFEEVTRWLESHLATRTGGIFLGKDMVEPSWNHRISGG